MIERFALPVLMALLVAASAWLLKVLDPEAVRVRSAPGHSPDLFVENFLTTTMDQGGQPLRRLSAQYMEHFPDTDTHELQNPYLVLYSAGGQPWEVRSERGWSSKDGEVLLLQGKVHIWRDDPDGTRALDIWTSDMRILPDSDYGETDKPVVIRTPTSETKGVGMRAYLEHKRIELLSRVQSLFEQSRE